MVKVACYKSMIRPILEYASTVWSPYTKKNILMIEAVQRRAARFVTNTYNQTSSVTAMLFRLGWPSLEQRHKIAKTTMMYKFCTTWWQFHSINTGHLLLPIQEATRNDFIKLQHT